jgi:hypothetical protein
MRHTKNYLMELRPNPELPLAYFSLQLDYAKRAAQVLKIPIDQALMEFTSFWRRIHNPLVLKTNKQEWSFDPETPQWRELCYSINNNQPADIVAHELYLKNNNGTETGKQYFGCFRYDFTPEADNDQGVITIHFKNRDNSGEGPLSKERQKERHHDLKTMFEHISNNYPQATIVKGGSWLYNLDSYRRLFPEIFTTGMTIEEIPFPRSSGIWGQFLDSNGKVNDHKKYNFLLKVNTAKNADQLLQCFEFRILFPKAGIENFYNHFSIKR